MYLSTTPLALGFSRWLSIIALVLTVTPSAFAAKAEVYTSVFSNYAAGGYDVTSYFTENKAVKGNKKYGTTYKDARWIFASQENLDKFLSDPERYAPKYGGYCAWAAAQGYTAKGDPKHWSMHEGKLYLNYDAEIKRKWLDDKEYFITEADGKWPGILQN